VDPPGCKDIDDALHVRCVLKGGGVEVRGEGGGVRGGVGPGVCEGEGVHLELKEGRGTRQCTCQRLCIGDALHARWGVFLYARGGGGGGGGGGWRGGHGCLHQHATVLTVHNI
jgi:hypothetical protein